MKYQRFKTIIKVQRYEDDKIVLFDQVELTGSSVFDYVHQADHAELAEQIGVTLASPGDSPTQTEEGAGGQGGAVPPIPDGKPCKW